MKSNLGLVNRPTLVYVKEAFKKITCRLHEQYLIISAGRLNQFSIIALAPRFVSDDEVAVP